MNYLYLLLPILSVYSIGSFYPIEKDAGKEVAYRPPGWVFGVVWPILLLLIGRSWTLAPELTKYYIILTTLLASWSIFYTNNRTYAFLNILTSIGITIYLILSKFKKLSAKLLMPLLGWLIFASYLSYNSI
jgi:benzodiazapine receptor